MLKIQSRSFLKETDVARMWGITDRALQAMRLRGDGPPYHKIGRLVRYRLSDLELWLDQRRRTSTSNTGVGDAS